MPKKTRRASIEPSAKMSRALNKSRKTGIKVVIDGITINPPKADEQVWRLRTSYNNVSYERKSRDDNGQINAAFIELIAVIESLQLGAAGLPEHANKELHIVIEKYIEQGGANNNWRGKTPKNRKEDFAHLIQIAKRENLKCSDISASVVRRYLSNATSSAKRAKGLIGVVRTFVKWGTSTGYFTHRQLEAVSNVAWSPPEGSNYKVAPTRREQSEIHYGGDGVRGGQVPTHEQVTSLAKEMQKYYLYGEAFAHVAANLGTRANETFIFTASKKVHEEGFGNYVDIANEVVRIHWQSGGRNGQGKRVTKSNRFRSVVIPPVENIRAGFDIYQWLRERSEDALKEQKKGTNPLALIFPSAQGQVWNADYFNSSVMRPALNGLGWRMPAYQDASGKDRHMYRFTLHSLRDRYGTTAADEWGYSERQLLEQGCWADPETVRSFYLGTDDSTHETVRSLHRNQARFRANKKAI